MVSRIGCWESTLDVQIDRGTTCLGGSFLEMILYHLLDGWEWDCVGILVSWSDRLHSRGLESPPELITRSNSCSGCICGRLYHLSFEQSIFTWSAQLDGRRALVTAMRLTELASNNSDPSMLPRREFREDSNRLDSGFDYTIPMD